MRDRRIQLKVKIYSLAEEAAYIHRQEGRERFWKQDLADHRRFVIRPISRRAQLAYAFIRGMSFRQVEPFTQPDELRFIGWADVKAQVARFGLCEAGLYAGLKGDELRQATVDFKAAKVDEASRFDAWQREAELSVAAVPPRRDRGQRRTFTWDAASGTLTPVTEEALVAA